MELGGDEDNIYFECFQLGVCRVKKGFEVLLFNYQDTVVKYLFLILFSCIIGLTECNNRGEDSANTEVARKKREQAPQGGQWAKNYYRENGRI